MNKSLAYKILAPSFFLVVFISCSVSNSETLFPNVHIETEGDKFEAGQILTSVIHNETESDLEYASQCITLEKRKGDKWLKQFPNRPCQLIVRILPEGESAVDTYLLDSELGRGTYRLRVDVRTTEDNLEGEIFSNNFSIR